jgi:release factor glutamine methyltransferase
VPLVDVLTKSTEYLRGKGVASPRLDAELILAHVLGIDRVKVYMQFDRPLSESELSAIRSLVRRRGSREPLAWVVGHKEFHGHEFTVAVDVLVPRPDTETLVEAALSAIGTEEVAYVADVGCGTGCVGISIALARENVRVYCTDVSLDAIACTRENVRRHGLEKRVAVLRGDLLDGVPSTREIDWVVSNPPYVVSGEIAGLMEEVRREPRLALDGGDDGLEVYRRLVPQAFSRARKGAWFEVGVGQSSAVAGILREAGFGGVGVRKDLAGVERVVGGSMQR